MRKRIGVLLSGCGLHDGCEIHEAVLTMLAIDRLGAETVCIAPNIEQLDVVNHLTGDTVKEKRNVLIESARIARGKITDLNELDVENIDAIIIPGGYGAVKNLSNFAVKGTKAEVNKRVDGLLKKINDSGKPIGAMCIAPATLVKAISHKSPKLTIGNDNGTAAAIEKMGGKHEKCDVDKIKVDEKNKVVSTPAYMVGPGMKDIAVGIEKLVTKVISMA